MEAFGVWLSIVMRSTDKKMIKGVLCTNEGEIHLFDSQLEANRYWSPNKKKYSIPNGYEKVDAVPQVFRRKEDCESIMEKLEAGERIRIFPS